MKTKKIATQTGRMLTFLMAALVLLATTGCEDEPPIPPEELPKAETQYSGNIMTQDFWVSPEGGTFNLIDGALEIVIPKGAVSHSTEFSLTSFPVHYLDLEGYNLYDRGFYLEGDSPEQMFPGGISFKIRYDMVEGSWLKSVPVDERNLQIYWGSPTLYFSKKVDPVGECCVDRNCKIVIGCLGKCGFYVVGEK
jgi:hypothetical protein